MTKRKMETAKDTLSRGVDALKGIFVRNPSKVDRFVGESTFDVCNGRALRGGIRSWTTVDARAPTRDAGGGIGRSLRLDAFSLQSQFNNYISLYVFSR